MTLKIGVSGHRQLENPLHEKEEIILFLKNFQGNSDVVAISSLAEGADTIFANVALELGIPLMAMLPLSQEEYKKDFNGEALEEFEKLIKQAKSVDVVSGKDSGDDSRENAYYECGKKVVDTSNHMLFVYDGLPSRGKGGTGEVFEYCLEKEKEYTHILTFRTIADRLHHIKDLREGSNGKSKEAQKLKARQTTLWNIAMAFGIIAAFLLSISLSFTFNEKISFLFTSFDLSFIIIVIVIFLFAEKRKLKDKRIHARRDADLLKRTAVFMEAGIPLVNLSNISLFSKYGSKNIAQLVQGAVSEIKDLAHQKKALSAYLTDQIKYHKENRIEPIGRRLKNLSKFQNISYVIFVITALFQTAIFFRILPTETIDLFKPGVTFLNLFIPLLLGSIEAHIYFKDYKRDKLESEYLLTFFQEWLNEIPKRTNNEFLKLSNEIQVKLDDENIYWCISTDASAINKLG